MQIGLRSNDLTLLHTTNLTTAGTSIANPGDQYGSPMGAAGVIEIGGNAGGEAAPAIIFVPLGEGSATTLLMSVFAWDQVNSKFGGRSYWTAWPLATFTVTLCTLAPLAGTDAYVAATVAGNQRYAGTVTLGVGNANISNEVISPTGNIKATIVLDTKGARFIQPLGVLNSSSTSFNWLYKVVG